MANSWFRIHAEGPSSIIDSDKVFKLSDRLFRWLIMLWACACKNDGTLPAVSKIAFRLRRSEKAVTEAIQALADKRFIDRYGNDLKIHDWDDHQFLKDRSVERVRAFRERKRNESGNDSGNDSGNGKSVTVTDPRARARASESVSVSESESESGSSGKGMQGEGENGLQRTPISDPQWFQFREQWVTQGWTPTESFDDWRRAEFAWRDLDSGQRLEAIAGLSRDLVGRDNCLPQNYLEKRMWTRGVRKASSSGQDLSRSERATINATRKFLEKYR